MARAIFNGMVIAESDRFETVDGNIYFPPEALRREYFLPTDHSTVCGWKGTANYYTVAVRGEQAENAAWTYRMPKEAAANIKDFIAFYPTVTVEP
ncbi:MAG: DUF427 domain-containing protein [Alphaproteobacteria bacterium]|nr:DUF427 domain-containing protein [Alphaproteobacteria bacterium]